MDKGSMARTVGGKYKLWIITILVTLGLATLLSGCDELSGPVEDSKVITDLAIGTSATVNGVTVTVNSVIDGPLTATGSPSYEVSVTYVNHYGRSISITPYDWSTVLANGNDRPHVGGSSFHLTTLNNGEEWTGIVTLWNVGDPVSIKFESSFLSIANENKIVTWTIS